MAKIPKLTAIHYKIRDNDYALASIQFIFNYGELKSPVFGSDEAEKSSWSTMSIEIDPE
jgi:hypothetical protein